MDVWEPEQGPTDQWLWWAVLESPGLFNRSSQSKTRVSRNWLPGTVCIFKVLRKGQNACSHLYPAWFKTGQRQTAFTVIQWRDRCRVPGAECSAQNVTEHSRMGGGGAGVGMTFSGLPYSHPGTQSNESWTRQFLWSERGGLSYVLFVFSGCFPTPLSFKFPIKNMPQWEDLLYDHSLSAVALWTVCPPSGLSLDVAVLPPGQLPLRR